MLSRADRLEVGGFRTADSTGTALQFRPLDLEQQARYGYSADATREGGSVATSGVER